MRRSPLAAVPDPALESAPPASIDRAAVLAWLGQAVPPARLRHILGVETMAAEVAQRHGVSVGSLVAAEQFGEHHPDVLAAIRHHTLGEPGMSVLSCIVFLADALEPNRGSTEQLVGLRQLSYTHLYRAVGAVADASIRHLLDRPALIHPRTIQTRNWALQCAS